MVDVDDGEGERLGAQVGLGAGPLQRLVESLAVRQAGQSIRHGVAAHLLQVLPQPIQLLGGVGQLAFQHLVLILHLARRGGQAVDHVAHGDGVLAFKRLAGGGQLLAVGLAHLAGRLDGPRHGVQFLGQALAGVEDLIGHLGGGQVAGGDLLAHLVGERLARGDHAVDLGGQRGVLGRDIVDPELEVERGGPDAVGFHGVDGPPGQSVPLGAAKKRFDLRRHDALEVKARPQTSR